MGRLAPGSYDDVFVSKFKKMICSSLDKSCTPSPEASDDDQAQAQRPASPAHSAMLFESFVSSLDEHDPFISALLDVLVKEVTSRGGERRKRRHDEHVSGSRERTGNPARTMTHQTAEALRRLLRTTITTSLAQPSGPGSYRPWAPGSYPYRSRYLGAEPSSETAVSVASPFNDYHFQTDEETLSRINYNQHYPILPSEYAEVGMSNPYGSSWTSRFGGSGPSSSTPPPLPPPISSIDHSYRYRPMSPPPAPWDSPPDEEDGLSVPERTRQVTLDEAERETARLHQRATDFLAYSTRRRAIQRRTSQRGLDGSAESSESVFSGLRGRPGSSGPPRFRVDLGDGEPAEEASSADARTPSVSSLVAAMNEARNSAATVPDPRLTTSNSTSGLSSSFDELTSRLQSYPRRGSTGYDDTNASFGPSTLSIRTTPLPPPTMLLTQGRPRSRERSSSPPSYSSATTGTRTDAFERFDPARLRRMFGWQRTGPAAVPTSFPPSSDDDSSASATVNPHLLHNHRPRQPVRVPEIHEPDWTRPSSSSSSSTVRRQFSIHSHSNSRNHLNPPSNLPSSSILGGESDLLYRSPSPMPPPPMPVSALPVSGSDTDADAEAEAEMQADAAVDAAALRRARRGFGGDGPELA